MTPTLSGLPEDLPGPLGPDPGTGRPEDLVVAVDAGPLAETAVAIWRLRRKVESTEDAAAGIRYHARAAADALAEAGVETRAYDGAVFDPGMRIRVLAYQPTPGLDQEVIIETVRPAVYVHDVMIAPGEVIVGTTPEEDAGAAAPAGTAADAAGTEAGVGTEGGGRDAGDPGPGTPRGDGQDHHAPENRAPGSNGPDTDAPDSTPDSEGPDSDGPDNSAPGTGGAPGNATRAGRGTPGGRRRSGGKARRGGRTKKRDQGGGTGR